MATAEALTEGELTAIKQAIFAPGLEPTDIERWYEEKIEICELDGLRFGLVQRTGGPCGVLAALQAFILRELIVQKEANPAAGGASSSSSSHGYPQNLLEVEGTTVCQLPLNIAQASTEKLTEAIANAVAVVLWQAAEGVSITSRNAIEHEFSVEMKPSLPEDKPPVYVVEAKQPSFDKSTSASAFKKTAFRNFPELQQKCRHYLQSISKEGGIMLVVKSLLLSRGLERIQGDMDETSSLVQKFGHCSQELLNLLLTGRATSNVHDGSKSLSPELENVRLEGVSGHPLVGYLSHLEALRYFEVGTYYKEPVFPIWVIASQSHFTVLYGMENDVIQASKSSILRRTFEKYDPSLSGFVQVDKLQPLLNDLGFTTTTNDPVKLEACKKKLDSEGIIIWQQLWSLLNPVIQGNADESSLWGGSGDGSSTPLFNKEMDEQTLAAVARSVFDKYDLHGGLFVEAEKVPDLLRDLNIDLSESRIQQLKQQFVDQAGVALWDTFWVLLAPDIKQYAERTEKPADGGEAATEASTKKDRRLDLFHYNGLTNTTQNPSGTHVVMMQNTEDTANIQEQMQDVDMALQMSLAAPEAERDTNLQQESSSDPPPSPTLRNPVSADSNLASILSTKWKGSWIGRMDDLHKTAQAMKGNKRQIPPHVDRTLLWRYHVHTMEQAPSID